ncbi:MAG TPA: hypothetical protein PLZ94_12895 [Armatimonadota bacterium]|nr:hypothetical protein [Armatimonadota bacterium]HPO73437.1 hypothetical protein [Armatimonadota bacterium]
MKERGKRQEEEWAMSAVSRVKGTIAWGSRTTPKASNIPAQGLLTLGLAAQKHLGP